MITKINSLLLPLELILKKYKKLVSYFILFLAFCSLYYITNPDAIKESGENALLVLWIILWIPIFARVFNINIARQLLPLRKELGILMGTLAFIHSGTYILEDPGYILTKDFWIYDGQINFLAAGFFALLFTIPLTLTTNNWSMKRLGKYWKYLHRGAYAIIIFTVAHVVLLQWSIHFEYLPVVILGTYFLCKILEWKKVSFNEKKKEYTYPKGQKYYCIPCGYIYDPLLGDKDSGISPGTEFSDIPNDWMCPECGVTKSDFVPYIEDQLPEKYPAKIKGKDFLNATTLELIIETEDTIVSIPGQFITFYWEDEAGEFRRQYSIAIQKGKELFFTIKLGEKARGGKLLREINIGKEIFIGKPAGTFLLKKTENQKIFIATGTGLAPIYNMILSLPKSLMKVLYFSVATEKDLFYIDKLFTISNLEIHIHVTKEKVEGYHEGRINIKEIEAGPSTEWYLCGNPKMISEAKEILIDRGFSQIYSEEFN